MECKKCILRTEDDKYITFNKDGICNHCTQYDSFALKKIISKEERNFKLSELTNSIKKNGKKYDCIIGLSGGVDSTYVAYLVKKLGLKPLAIHLDNGWNSELAVDNINKIVSILDIDLYTHVIDWEEFKDLQLSYLKASVVDIEALTDHAITAILYKIASKHGVKYILNGANVTTEGVLPESWIHYKNDLVNIKGIQNQFGSKKIKTFPTLGLFKKMYFEKIKNIKIINILNFIEYNKEDAKKLIMNELAWRDYGGKHYESIFTRFYQAYILPKKFNIDKRRSHLSTLICSEQISKEEALQEISKPVCDSKIMEQDKEYVLKKFGLTDTEFDVIMKLPIKNHTDYPSMINRLLAIKPFVPSSFKKLIRL